MAKGDVHAGETLFSLSTVALPCLEEFHQAEVLFVIGMTWTRCPALQPGSTFRSPEINFLHWCKMCAMNNKTTAK